VYACTVVITPCRIPNASWTILATGARQFVVQEGVGDDVVAFRVVDVVEVHAEHHRDVGLLGRRGHDHLARARLQVAAGAGAVAEEPGRLDHDVDPQIGPRQGRRILFGEDRDLHAVDADSVLECLDAPAEAPEDGVEAQQVGDRVGRHQVVDRGPLDVGALLERGPQRRAPDAAEAVDRYTDRHVIYLRVGVTRT
jgi:hypothetical protein